MGEFVKGSLTLQQIKQDGTNEWLCNLSSDFKVRTGCIDFSNNIGRGFQSSMYGISDSDDRVAKLLKLKMPHQVTESEIAIAVSSIYASNIGVGPVVYGSPFITSDGVYVAIVMDKVSLYTPNEGDVNEIILLFEKMIENQFMTFDMEYGKTSSGKIVMLDFGVSGFYPSKYDALKSAIQNDIFANTGLGYYNRAMEEHFLAQFKSTFKKG